MGYYTVERVGRTLTIKGIRAVQDFDHKQGQEVFCLAGRNQHQERRSVGCGAFLGVFLSQIVVIIEITGIEAGCGGSFYDWQGVPPSAHNHNLGDVQLCAGRISDQEHLSRSMVSRLRKGVQPNERALKLPNQVGNHLKPVRAVVQPDGYPQADLHVSPRSPKVAWRQVDFVFSAVMVPLVVGPVQF